MGAAKLRVAVAGATGYVGMELVRLLRVHPHVELTRLFGHQAAGKPVASTIGSLWGLHAGNVEPFSAEAASEHADVVFCALPHGASSPIVQQLIDRNLMVLDLSADLRLQDTDAIRHWYGEPAATSLRNMATYGLVELHRAEIAQASLIAVPGCYATTSILTLAPLIQHDLVDRASVIVDAKSGASGAGRSPSLATHLPEIADGVRAYKTAGAHRHIPEIEQELSILGREPIRVTFTPQLLPTTRGILVTAYATVRTGVTARQCQTVAEEFYQDSPFVHVLPDGTNPDTMWVRGSNHVHLNYQIDERTNRVLAQGTLDNLVKGAAGQAIQCMNVRYGFAETAGLEHTALFP
jgi:N-acetyl-gamma-glutamyl-phosphate reductase